MPTCDPRDLDFLVDPMTNRVIEAPQWLKDRMEAIRKLPSPTLEEVEQTFRASADWRKALGNSYK